MKRVVCKRTGKPRTLTQNCLCCQDVGTCDHEALVNKEVYQLI